MAGNNDQVALGWVRDEVAKTLDQSRHALETFAQDTTNEAQIKLCASGLHQVRGTLQLLDFPGAVALSEALESLSLMVAAQPDEKRSVSLEALMGGILQLNLYLQKIYSGQPDQKFLLLPAINEIRLAQGLEPLKADDTTPDIDGVEPPKPSSGIALPDSEADFTGLTKKLRHHFQRGLLGIIKQEKVGESLQRIHKVLERLEALCYGHSVSQLWWIADGFVSSLKENSGHKEKAAQALLGKIDRQIKRLADLGKAALGDQIDQPLLLQLLQKVQVTNVKDARTTQIRNAFLMDGADKGQFSGVSEEALEAASVAMRESIETIKDGIDIYVRNREHTNDDFERLLPQLKQVADTLMLLGMMAQRTNLLEQIKFIKQSIAADTPVADVQIMDIAGALLMIEAGLGELDVTAKTVETDSASTGDLVAAAGKSEFLAAQFQFIREARVNLQRVQDAIVDFMASGGDRDAVTEVPVWLKDLEGGFAVLSLENVAAMLGKCRKYVEQRMLLQHMLPAQQELDALADVLTGVEYYLEGFDKSGSHSLDTVLETSAQSLQILTRYVEQNEQADSASSARSVPETVVDAAPIAQPAVAAVEVPKMVESETTAGVVPPAKEVDEELVDDEIRDIFIEEAEEELVSLQQTFPAWRKNTDLEEELTTCRRSFHTLKGSGRLVGATTIGELAWSVENMLNKLIAGIILPSDNLFAVVEGVIGLLPELIAAFRNHSPSSAPVEELVARAEALALGEAVAAAVATTSPTIIADDDAKPAETETETAEPSVTAAAELGHPGLPQEAEEFVDELLETEPGSTEPVDEIYADADLDVLPTGAEPEWALGDASVRATETENIELELPDAGESERVDSAAVVEASAEATTAAEAEPAITPDALTAAAHADETGMESGLDQSLLEVFESETRIHLDTINDFIDESLAKPGEQMSSDELVRALHTIKGSANMTGARKVAALFTPLEGHFRQLNSRIVEVSVEAIATLGEVSAYVERHLGHLGDFELADDSHELAALQARIEALDVQIPAAVVEEESTAEDSLVSFLADSQDQLDEMHSLLLNWRDISNNRDGFLLLLGGLNTLLERARELEFAPIVQQVKATIRVLEKQQSLVEDPDRNFFDLMDAAIHGVNENLDRLAASQRPKLDGGLMHMLEHFVPSITLPIAVNEEESSIPLPILDELTDDDTLELSSAAATVADGLEAIEVNEVAEPVSLEAASEPPLAEDEAAAAVLDEHVPSKSKKLADRELSLPSAGDSGPVEVAQPDMDAAFADGGQSEQEEAAEIMALFLDEADDIIEQSREQVELWKDIETRPESGSTTLRLLHTLKGAARLAEADAIGDVSHQLETLLESDVPTPEVTGSLLENTIDALAEMVQSCHRGETPGARPELIEQLRAACSGDADVIELPDEQASPLVPVTPVEKAQPGAASRVVEETLALNLEAEDREILDIYLEEARELLTEQDDTLQLLRDEPASAEHLQLLQRELHTLKGGARLSGLTALADLSHELETLFEAAVNGLRRVDAGLILLAQESRDRMDSMLDEITAQEQITSTHALIAQIQGYARGEVIAPVVADEVAVAAEAEGRETRAAEERNKVVPLIRRRVGKEQEKARIAPVVKVQKVAPQVREMIRVGADTLENLANLAGETSIYRSRLEQQVSNFRFNVEEIAGTVERVRQQLRNLEIETEAQVIYRRELVGGYDDDEFDPLEMDRYSRQQELTRGLGESTNDLLSLKETLETLSSDAELLLLQQARVDSELQERIMRTRLVSFTNLVPRLRRMVRQIGQELDKPVQLSIQAEGEMDRTILERLIAPIEHMLRNAIDHGIETASKRKKAKKPEQGRVLIRLYREGSEVVIEIADDGRGIDLAAVRNKAVERGVIAPEADLTDHELQLLILEAGFSTAEKVTQISGRGVGMDVVNSEIKAMGGLIDISSATGKGSTFIVRLPFTVSVNQALMVSGGEEMYAIPLTNIEGIVRVSPYELAEYYNSPNPEFLYAGQPYALHYLGKLLDAEQSPRIEGLTRPVPLLLLHGVEHPVAMQVDDLQGSREIVVKSVGTQLSGITGISGATILGDGRVVLILDLPALLRRADAPAQEQAAVSRKQAEVIEQRQPLVMVVDDSITVRKVTGRLLERNHFDVITAKDGVDAVTVLHDRIPDIMLLDIEMPRMDGFELATIIRHDERLKGIPIIMITSRTGDKHKKRAKQIGVNEYMGKPFNEVDLLRAIEDQLGR